MSRTHGRVSAQEISDFAQKFQICTWKLKNSCFLPYLIICCRLFILLRCTFDVSSVILDCYLDRTQTTTFIMSGFRNCCRIEMDQSESAELWVFPLWAVTGLDLEFYNPGTYFKQFRENLRRRIICFFRQLQNGCCSRPEMQKVNCGKQNSSCDAILLLHDKRFCEVLRQNKQILKFFSFFFHYLADQLALPGTALQTLLKYIPSLSGWWYF